MKEHDRLDSILKEYHELQELLAQPDVMANGKQYQEYMKKFARISKIAEKIEEFRKLEKEIEYLKDTIDDPDPEMAVMAEEELNSAVEQFEKLEEVLNLMLVPPDPFDDKRRIVCVRAVRGSAKAE